MGLKLDDYTTNYRDQLVEEFGNRAIDIISNGIGITGFNPRKNVKCPFHNDKSPSLGWDKDNYRFNCFGCDFQMNIIDYYMDYESLSYIQALNKLADELGKDKIEFGKSYDQKKEDKSYQKPKSSKKAETKELIEHIKKRGLKQETINHYRIEEATHAFRIDGEFVNRKAIVFPYYDEYGELIHKSYRTSDKHFSQSKGTKSIMHGAWHVDFTKTLYVTEGQFDAMALWQSGIKNVVSVPAGAQNRKYLEINYDFLSKFENIIFWIDNDEPGRTAGSNFKSKFQQTKIITHDKYKDANDFLLAEGEDQLNQFATKDALMPNSIKTLNQMGYRNTTAPEDERIETGFKEFDVHVKDWRIEQLSIVVGRGGEGKSTFVSQVVAHQLIKNSKTFLFSAELGEQDLQDWLFRQLIGKERQAYQKLPSKYGDQYYIKDNVLKAIKKWIKDTLYIANRQMASKIDNLFNGMEILAKKFGVNLFIIDNLQSTMEENAATIYSDQSNFVERCRQFVIRNKVHMILITHTRKTDELDADENTMFGNITKNDIAGSKNISNKAHNVISIERNFNKKADEFDMILTNLKDKKGNIRKGFKYNYDPDTFRFYSDETSATCPQLWKKELGKDVFTKDYEDIEITEEKAKQLRGEKVNKEELLF